MKVAVLTKDVHLFKQVCDAFTDEDIHCRCFNKDHALIREFPRQSFSLIVVDALRYHFTTRHPVNIWRECYSDRSIPTIVIGEFLDLDILKESFYAGADDVVFDPMNPRELNMRAHILLSRQRMQRINAPLKINDYSFNKHNHTVCLNGQTIQLTAREFAIAWLFFSRPGHFFSRQQIAEAIWGSDEHIVNRTLEQHIYKLRQKLHLGRDSDARLKTIYAFGYRLDVTTRA